MNNACRFSNVSSSPITSSIGRWAYVLAHAAGTAQNSHLCGQPRVASMLLMADTAFFQKVVPSVRDVVQMADRSQ